MNEKRKTYKFFVIGLILFLAGCIGIPSAPTAQTETVIPVTQPAATKTASMTSKPSTPTLEVSTGTPPETQTSTATPTKRATKIIETASPTRTDTPDLKQTITLLPDSPISLDDYCADKIDFNTLSQSLFFVAEWDGDQEIYSIQADGENLTQLTNNEIDDFAPRWSPDGSKLAFLRQSSSDDYKPHLVILDAKTNVETEIVLEVDNILRGNYVWSPDSRKIAFDSMTINNKYEILIFDDTGNVLTTIAAEDLSFSGGYVSSWSPDSNLLLINTFLDQKGQVWRMAVADMEKTEFHPIRSNNEVQMESLGMWHPSEDKIIFISGNLIGLNQIFTMKSDGTNLMQLTNEEFSKYSIKWSPSGNVFLYETESYWLSPIIYLHVSIVNSKFNDVVYQGSAGKATNLEWSPDGRLVSFIEYENEKYNLKVVDICTKVVGQLADNISFNNDASWKP